MKIQCLGVSHNTVSIVLRECLASTPDQLNAALARLGRGEDHRWNTVGEFVILSTCNRVEFYAVADEPAFDTLEAFMAEVHGVPVSEFSSAMYRLLGDAAVNHLLRVAAGLDSMVLGEPQILGQVANAYSAARRHGVVGKILSKLFETAIRTGKRTRTETTIGHNPTSISSVAVKLIAETIPDLESAHILVVGAGEMAELAVEALRKRKVSRVTVVNRTLSRARTLADRWNGQAAAFEALPERLAEADAVIASTGAPHTILSAPMVETAMKSRPDRPLVLMDIAMPRDVEAGIGQLRNVRRFDMDGLAAHLEVSLARRKSQVPAVERILVEEQTAFLKYMAILDVVPIITEMRQQADSIRKVELEKALHRMPELSTEAQRQIQRVTQSIVNKILHKPTMGLRKAAEASKASDYAEIARDLFGLD